MTYFSSNYNRINYPISTETVKGLRNAQIGAIHAIGSHFTLFKDEAAIVIMPTGSGKTAVLNLSAYLLRAKRVLVISSSVMVRGQIVEEFSLLKTLKGSNVFHADLELPKVKEIKSPIKSLEEWEALKEFDVVVGIPNSINEGINDVFTPEVDLFDLILVDEAHHVPAFTWTNVVKRFTHSNKIFFTATPFRRDKKEIEGRVAYNYPLTKAYEDKIFGKIGYYPVITDSPDTDLAIAIQAETIFKQDKAAGLRHYMMVRTETKEEAENLNKLYSEKTSLKLKKVDSTLSYSTIKKTIEKLKAGDLDGIICVDMLGEGFDFPNLKIAAIHSPKKSLANTLQFIGRFARTNADNIGEAKFLAIPNDILIGKKKLYEEGAIWDDIIKNLSEEKIEEEDELKNVVDSFEKRVIPTFKDNISFYNLNPYRHVKIYMSEGVNLDANVEINGLNMIYTAKSHEHNAVVFIFREIQKPKWIASDDLVDINHFFLLVFYDEKTKLLFIHSSIKTNQFYDMMKKLFEVGDAKRISKFQLNKVLVDVANPEFFNIGMQNRSANSGESYRTSAGPNAERVITKSHGKNYANGHVFLKGIDKGDNITIGYSSGSKVWSNAYDKIPNYIKWCQHIGQKIVSDKAVKTNTGFDNLAIGKVIDTLPYKALIGMWNKNVFHNTPFLISIIDDELISRDELLDFDISIDTANSTDKLVWIDIILDEQIISLTYDFENHYQFRLPPECDFQVEEGSQTCDLISYLNENSFTLFLDDFAIISDHEYFEPPKEGEYRFELGRIISFDWAKYNTDIEREFYGGKKEFSYNPVAEKAANGNRNSIHEALQIKLIADDFPILIYDHGTGEIADFIAISESADRVTVTLYHIKGSGGVNAGDRVNDVYEVCMQAVKSQSWTPNKNSFAKKVLGRTDDKPNKFLVGNKHLFSQIMSKQKLIAFSFVIVQPGISADSISDRISYVLAATDDSLTTNGYEQLKVLGS
ncbi:MAG TPA: DEAD/DEAH box helicase family protein [Flavobacteriales bacterium]|nr:DEAD/DEAH box helicase family protein [Flavobacteriales bacterium]HRE96059.1 DEAD/DEAH box helicase family protein [Flavobacteriales bacterium]HRJ37979.1 DEAD/DEAH box helicase family protein [Flavobacteriales bacterium]